VKRSFSHPVVFIVVAGFFVLPGPAAGGGLYKYIGPDGHITVTNLPEIAAEPFPAAPSRAPAAVENPYRTMLRPHIRLIAAKYGLSPALIESMVEVESNFNPTAVSAKGAVGLMQLMPETCQRLNVKDPTDPIENLEAGVKHFHSLVRQFDGNLELALAAYNAGENLIQRTGGVPSIDETRNYVKNVLAGCGMEAKLETVAAPPPKPLYCFRDAGGTIHLTTDQPAPNAMGVYRVPNKTAPLQQRKTGNRPGVVPTLTNIQRTQ
jgi:hypothetical protein